MKTVCRWPRKMAFLVVSVCVLTLFASLHPLHPTDAYARCSKQASTATGGSVSPDTGVDLNQSGSSLSWWDDLWFPVRNLLFGPDPTANETWQQLQREIDMLKIEQEATDDWQGLQRQIDDLKTMQDMSNDSIVGCLSLLPVTQWSSQYCLSDLQNTLQQQQSDLQNTLQQQQSDLQNTLQQQLAQQQQQSDLQNTLQQQQWDQQMSSFQQQTDYFG